MRRILSKVYITLLLIIVTASFVQAQTAAQSARVSGSLLDEQGRPLMYATVSLLEAQDSTIVKGALSSDQGTYTFEHIKTGSYIIKASTVGYEKAISKPFSITDGKTEIKLPEKDAEMILKVISKLGGKVKLIDPKPPKLSPAAKKMKKDLEAAFKEVKLHQEGKIQLKTLSEVLDEL